MEQTKDERPLRETDGPYPLPEGWVWTTLDQCVDILDHKRVPINSTERDARIAAKTEGNLFPYYGATGQVGLIDDYLFDEELVLLGEDGAPFLEPNKPKAYIARGKFWVNNHAHVLRARDGLLLNALLQHYLNIFDYHDFVTGTTRLKLNQARMREILVPVPPLPEQRRIVAKIEELLSSLDAGVASLKRVQAALKRYRAAVLKAACEGRLVPQDPNDEPADKLLERILAERRAKWEADVRAKGKDPNKAKYEEPKEPGTEGLPELPRGWCWASVTQTGQVQLGRQRAPKHQDGPYMRPYLRVANVFEDRIDTSDVLNMNFTPAEYETYHLEYGDILLNEGQSPELLGRPAIYRNEVPGACFQNTLIRFKAHEGIIPEYALTVFLNCQGS
jgi:type I restriction enzyme S subunit